MLVYLHRPVDNLLQLIKKRGRDFEQKITPEYLQQLQNTYFEYFRSEMNIPILIVDVEKANFIEDPSTYKKLVALMSEDYKLGINYVMTNW